MSLEMPAAAITAAFVAGFSAGNDGGSTEIRLLTEAAITTSIMEARIDVDDSESRLEEYKPLLRSQGVQINELLQDIYSGSQNLVCLANLGSDSTRQDVLKYSPVGEDPDRFFSALNSIRDQFSHPGWMARLELGGGPSIENGEDLTKTLDSFIQELWVSHEALTSLPNCYTIDLID